MATPVVFADLYKPVKDFFSKGYNNQSIRVEGKAKGGDATLLTTFEQTATGITTTAEYEQVLKCPRFPSIAKIVYNSNGRFQPSLKFKTFANVSGLTVTVNADQPTTGEATKADFIETSAEYVQNQFFAKGAVRPLEQSFEGSLTVAFNKFLVGATAKANAKGLAGYTAGASYKSPIFFGAGTYANTGVTTIGGLYFYKKHIFGLQTSAGAKTTYELGWETKCGDTTVKAKVNQAQLISVSAQHKLSRVVATLSGDINPNKATVSKVGVKFLLEE